MRFFIITFLTICLQLNFIKVTIRLPEGKEKGYYVKFSTKDKKNDYMRINGE